MNYTRVHSLWEIWTVLGVSGGMEGGSNDKLPSLPVRLAPLSFLCSRRSFSEAVREGVYFIKWRLFCLLRHFGEEGKKKWEKKDKEKYDEKEKYEKEEE